MVLRNGSESRLSATRENEGIRESTTALVIILVSERYRPAIGQNIRIGIVSPYIVIYRYSERDDTVTVLRLVHGRRRITGKLLSETP